MKNNDFYIGWNADAPDSTARFIKKHLLLIFPVLAGLGLLLALCQKKFSSGNYEYGTPSTLTGVYFNKPVPMLRIPDGRKFNQQTTWMNVPLVGYGKHGADGIMKAIETEGGQVLNGREVVLRGTLLFSDGKTFLEINPSDSPLVSVSATIRPDKSLPATMDLGLQTLRGEIVDPKCFFGVMKPGEGKAHSDCAIRCILGGISPTFVVRDSAGRANYFLIARRGGGNVAAGIKSFVGKPVSVTADLVRYDDWIVMYLPENPRIEKLSYLQQRFGDRIIACVGH